VFIFASKKKSGLSLAIGELSKKFEITDDGEVDEYLGSKIEKRKDGTGKMIQPHLINQILETLGFNECSKGNNPLTTLSKCCTAMCRDRIGTQNGNSTRPDLA